MKKTILSIIIVATLLAGTFALAYVIESASVPGYQGYWNYNAASGDRSMAYSYVEVLLTGTSNSATGVVFNVFPLGTNTAIGTAAASYTSDTVYAKVYINEGYLANKYVKLGIHGLANFSSSYTAHFNYDLK